MVQKDRLHLQHPTIYKSRGRRSAMQTGNNPLLAEKICHSEQRGISLLGLKRFLVTTPQHRKKFEYLSKIAFSTHPKAWLLLRALIYWVSISCKYIEKWQVSQKRAILAELRGRVGEAMKGTAKIWEKQEERPSVYR